MNTIQQTAVFAEWLRGLRDGKARARIVARIEAASLGHFVDWKSVGHGVNEMRIDLGPGYRVYFLRAGAVIYVLLCGGDKSTQAANIARAKDMAALLTASAAKEQRVTQANAGPKGLASSKRAGGRKGKARKG